MFVILIVWNSISVLLLSGFIPRPIEVLWWWFCLTHFVFDQIVGSIHWILRTLYFGLLRITSSQPRVYEKNEKCGKKGLVHKECYTSHLCLMLLRSNNPYVQACLDMPRLHVDAPTSIYSSFSYLIPNYTFVIHGFVSSNNSIPSNILLMPITT